LKSHGFRDFTFELHIPYYVLKKSIGTIEDSRKNFDGKPLRRSWPLTFLSRPTSELPTTNKVTKDYVLYETQLAIVITGFDDFVYGCVDTYFRSGESVKRYHNWKQGWGRTDPLARGQIDADLPIWTPREYFLRVCEIRIRKVQGEWNRITEKMEEVVKEYVQC
jgi:hypothetical protein